MREFIFKYSVQNLLVRVAEDRNLDVEVLNQVRAQSLAEKNAQVVLMPGAREVLAWADESGIQQFIYTHKGNNAFNSILFASELAIRAAKLQIFSEINQ